MQEDEDNLFLRWYGTWLKKIMERCVECFKLSNTNVNITDGISTEDYELDKLFMKIAAREDYREKHGIAISPRDGTMTNKMGNVVQYIICN